MSKVTKPTVYNDILGHPLSIGAPVAYSDRNVLRIGFIEKFTPKMVRIKRVSSTRYETPAVAKYPYDVSLVDEKAVTMYLLRKQ